MLVKTEYPTAASTVLNHTKRTRNQSPEVATNNGNATTSGLNWLCVTQIMNDASNISAVDQAKGTSNLYRP